tara:strand:- start:3008 stop:4363 length:1356 start_codon:yes stop_codon:yes gene_type:complete
MDKKFSTYKKKYFKFTNYIPHEGQLKLHFPVKDARFTVAVCGRRWGKSISASKEIEAIITQPNKRAWVVAPSYQLAEKVFREVWHELITKQGIPTRRASYRDMFIETEWGSVFEGKSADNPPSLVGEGLDYLVLDEAAKQKATVWDMYLRPTLSDRKGKALFITTPEGYNWVYEKFLLGKTDKDWASITSPSWENQYAYPKGLEDEDLIEAKRNMSQEVFEQEYGAMFTSFAGRVYPFDRMKDLGDFPYQSNLPTYACIDFGYRMPAVAWFQTCIIDGIEHVNVIDEFIHQERISTDELIKVCKEKFLRYRVVATFGDPAGINVQSSSGMGDIEKFRRNAMNVRFVRDKISRKLETGISHVRSFIENADGLRRLHLNKNCMGLAEDLENYRYPEHKEGSDLKETPVKDGYHDHGCDMLRYFFLNRFPIKQQGIKFVDRNKKDNKWHNTLKI